MNWSALFHRMVDRPATNSSSQALMWGLAWLIIGAIVGWRFDLVPTSMLSYTWGSARLIWHTAFGLTMWVSSTVVFFAGAAMLNRCVSIAELFGRMLFAHWPVTLAMLPGILTDKIAYSTFMRNPGVAFEQSPMYASLLAVIMTIILVWYLYWGYCAFRRSVSRSGVVTFVVYVIAFVLSVYLSRVTLGALYAGIW